MMNLHTDKELFRDAVQATTDIMNMREAFIERLSNVFSVKRHSIVFRLAFIYIKV
jgi:hypothetical protein